MPDDRLGDRLVALVVPRAAGFDGAALVAWSADRIVHYKRPRIALAVEALPRGGNGKLDRGAWRALALRLVPASAP